MKSSFYKVVSTAALAAIIAGTGAIGATGTVQAASAAEAGQTEQTVNIKNVDKKLVDAALAKLKEYAKGSVSFNKAETTEYNGEAVSLSWQKNGKLAGSVYVKPDGKVVRVYLDLKYAQLNDTLKSKLSSAWKQLYQKRPPDLRVWTLIIWKTVLPISWLFAIMSGLPLWTEKWKAAADH